MQALQALARRRGGKYTVVFDGPPGDGFVADVQMGKVSVVFAGSRSADAVVLARLRQARQSRDWTVISDDAELVRRCRDAGARHQSVRQLVQQLRGLALPGRFSKDNPQAVDVDEWEAYFRGETPEED